MNIQVIYEDKDIVVLNKPSGLLVHGTAHNVKEASVADWLLEHYPEVKTVGDKPEERPGIVHRLDKETSGVLVVARTQTAFEYLKKLFQDHQIKKTYIALVAGRVQDSHGVIDKAIGIKNGTIKRSVHSEKMAKAAITEYQVLNYLKINEKDYTLLAVVPRTGRTHQIRVHLNFLGHPVMGDKLYGGKRAELNGLERQFLHAATLEFVNPHGEKMRLEADLPMDLQSWLK